MRRNLVTAIFFFFGIAGISQEARLILEHAGKMRRWKFSIGDSVGIRIRESRHIQFGIITELTGDRFCLNRDPISLLDIDRFVRVRDGSGQIAAVAANLRYLGHAFVPVIYMVNVRTVDVSFQTALKAAAIVGGFHAVAWLLMRFQKRTYKTGKNWKLRISDFPEMPGKK